MRTLSRRDAASEQARANAETAFIEAARGLLAENHSFGELGIEAIARRAGYSRPTFYAYFRDKRDLLFRMGELLGSALYAEAGAWLEDRDPDLRGTLERVLAVFTEQRAAVRALVEASTYDEEVARLWRDLHGRFIHVARERIRASQPDVSESVAEARGFALVWMTERAFVEHLMAPTVAERELIDAIELFWRTAVSRAT